jgi:broad specificity phosphatase PhoE
MGNPKLKTLYLIRHGETDPNKNQIIQGSGLDAPLNDTGRRQAFDFFQAYRHIPFDAIYTSALIRTSQSVVRFIEMGIPHFPFADLNEISWGIKDGTQINKEEQLIYNQLLRDWQGGLLDRSFAKGESPNQVARRLNRVIEFMFNEPSHQIILMSIHGRALRIMLCLLLKRPLSDMEQFLHSNLCLYILQFDGISWKIELSNDTTHFMD